MGRAHTRFVPPYPHYRLGEPVSILRCCTNTYYFKIRSNRLGYGSRLRPRLTSRDFRDLRACLHYYTSCRACRSVGHQGTFLLFHLWARVLFEFGASHSFVAASCVKDLGSEVETLEELLHVSSPLGTRANIDNIFLDCELEISGILLTVDHRVMDMSEFDVILGMDCLTTHRVVIDCDRRRVTAYTLDGNCFMF